MEGLRNLILGIGMLSLIWACTLCLMHPSCFFGSFNQSSLLRAAFHQTSNDVALFDHVPTFTSVALACHQCISGLWMTSFHWADCSGLILCRGVGFLCRMYSCSLFTHWKILRVDRYDEAWPYTRGGLPLSISHDYLQWAPSFWSTLPHLFSECLTSPVSGYEW